MSPALILVASAILGAVAGWRAGRRSAAARVASRERERNAEMDAVKSEFQAHLANASKMRHDLVQPLGTIVNYAELIREISDGESREHARTIAGIATRMAERIRTPAPGAAPPEPARTDAGH